MRIAYRAKDLAEAHIVAGLLRARGIESHVGGHFLQGAMGEIGASGFTNVHVDDDDYPKAREIVGEYERSSPRLLGRPRPNKTVDRYARGFLAILLLIVLALFLAVSW
ncbi:putative signal transducing protein [Marinobacter sp. SS21]|uniref:putative signal transducing protein n=1 Tax=Marinobacter sp. SS21 TaxID=2979460 RepID=UPI00232FD88C|nr:DUF2007 domain-containing protein [Marinobacter sp. SS21]MDC0661532.1 DUF2007 domain-containing protein [Marinobacter sp. SS21]